MSKLKIVEIAVAIAAAVVAAAKSVIKLIDHVSKRKNRRTAAPA